MRLVSFLRPDGGATPHFGALIGANDILDASSEAAGLARPDQYLDWFDTAGAAHSARRGKQDVNIVVGAV